MWSARSLFMLEVPVDQVPFVVPFESHSNFVGSNYIKKLAKLYDADFARNPKDIGLVTTMDVLRGPSCDPSKIHALIREFYEHTTRFELSVKPKWHPLAMPVFWLFRKLFAEQIEQVNLPFDVREAKQGVVSNIDTLDFDHDKIVDLRGWVRTYKRSGDVIYVGIYTTFRHEPRGYVSVGFPFPNANLTATLVPSNLRTGDFLLTTGQGVAPFSGDYLVWVGETTGRVTVARIKGFKEEIEVYVRESRLLTDHRFTFLGLRFVTLYYEISRKASS